MTTPEDYLRKRKAEQALEQTIRRRHTLPPRAEGPIDAVILSRLDALRLQINSLRQLILIDLCLDLEATTSESDLRQLCIEMDVDHENLAGPAKSDRLRELIHQLHKSGRLDELILAYERLHPGYRP